MERTTIKGILFDWDGSMVPQGGSIDPKVAQFLRFLHELGIKMGPATGKNADYMRGVASGVGISMWDYVVGESGAFLLRLIDAGPPPAFETTCLSGDGQESLSLFRYHARIDQIRRTLWVRGRQVSYRPELKEMIITLFPPDKDISVTEEWVLYFEEIIRTHRLNLKVQRHPDGCIDIVPIGISKGNGVLMVCKLLECKPKNILTVVNGSNDRELADGTTAIAVGNANQDLKELVTQQGGYVAEHLDGLGFMEGVFWFATKEAFGELSGKIIDYFKDPENVPLSMRQ
ncbi:MAG: HAD hydrolase family protein [Candidatus Paceibacterota bacterium]|jgi:HAD superfamily hydrolase (TIGR01484 family)